MPVECRGDDVWHEIVIDGNLPDRMDGLMAQNSIGFAQAGQVPIVTGLGHPYRRQHCAGQRAFAGLKGLAAL